MEAGLDSVRIEMLGQFRIADGDRVVALGDWPARRPRELVELLALSDGHVLFRDQVIEQLWPHLDEKAGAANLRKAAHHARRVLGKPEAVVLRAGRVELYPDHHLIVDVERFLLDARLALESPDDLACARVAGAYGGELLPHARYEAWTQEPGRQVHARLAELLRRAGEWEHLVEIEPTDEAACRELMRAAIDAGERHVAIRCYERLRIALIRDLGTRPSLETLVLHDRCTSGVRLDEQAFVGRDTELGEARVLLKSVAGGTASALIVRGSSGIGKSAFCRRVVDSARDDGWRVISVAASGAGVPYGPVGDAVEQLLVDGRGWLDTLPARLRSILTELSPLAGPAAPLAGPVTRHQVVAALRRALTSPTADTPTVILVEDAHLLDEATADVLHQIVAGGGQDPLLILLACRAEWIRTSLPRGITELASGDRTLSLRLGPLADDQLSELVALAAAVNPSPEVVARIVTAAQGSPFFAVELARGLTSAEREPLPETVRQAIGTSLAGLDPATLEALTSLAVVEDELDLASVLALTGLREQSAFAMLDAALDLGVLVVAGTRYRFRHALVRQVLTDELPAHRRVDLHRDAAGRLDAAGGAPELIAYHWMKGEKPEEAVDWLLAAARRAVSIGAFADALVQVEKLLIVEPAHHDGLCLRAEVLDALGDGRAPEAYAAAATALGDPEAQELRARQALAQLKASDPNSALRTLEGVNPKTTAGRLAEALTLSAAAAIGRYADADTAAEKAEVAGRLAIELGDPGFILDAAWAQALAAHAKGELPARLREFLRSTQDLPELATRVFDGQLCVTERMLYGGLPNDEIIAFADELASEASRIGAARGLAFALTLRGEAGLLAGRLEEADRDFTEGARLHGRIGAVAGEALSLLGSAQVAIYRGQPKYAQPLLADALLMARESEIGHHTLDRIYGAMVEAAPDPVSAACLVREAETSIQGPAETCPTCRIAFIVPATIASARAGDLDRAERYAQECQTALEIVALPPAWQAAVEEARGWVAHAGAHPDAARRHFGAAADGFTAWGQPLDAERCAKHSCD
ncbi:MAG: AAA family ATPase [Thermoleophilia bacterium]|nr:AAA family ATPase [Thermoleophilia bacterium]